MQKVLLLRNLSDSAGTDVLVAPEFFALAAHDVADFYETTFEDLVITVGEGEFTIIDAKNNLDLRKFDKIFIRGVRNFAAVCDVALAVGYYGRKHNVQVINDIEYTCQSKLAHAVRFESLNIPVAKTIWLSEAVLKDKKIASSLGFPCIMKETFGSLGKFNYKVNSFAEIKQHQDENPDKNFVLQRFVGGDGDFRLLIIGDEKLLIGYPVNKKKSYADTASDGYGAEVCPLNTLPRKAISDAVKIAKYMNMTISGSDILANSETGEYYFLEINAQPNLANLDDPVREKIATMHKFLAE